MNSFMFFAMTFLSSVVLAQSKSAELTCRAKAKEIAVQTYADCITTSKNAQIESVRTDYQSELAALKAKYDKKLKDISGDNTAAPQKKSKAKLNVTPAPVPVKGIAKQLPKKEMSTSEPSVVQEMNTETAVVTMKPESEESLESEVQDSDSQIVEMPVE